MRTIRLFFAFVVIICCLFFLLSSGSVPSKQHGQEESVDKKMGIRTEFYSEAFQIEIPLKQAEVKNYFSEGSSFSREEIVILNELLSFGQLVFQGTEYQASVDMVEQKKGGLFRLSTADEMSKYTKFGTPSASAYYPENRILFPEKFFENAGSSGEVQYLTLLSTIYHEVDHLVNDYEYPETMDAHSRFTESMRREIRNHGSDLRRIAIIEEVIKSRNISFGDRLEAAIRFLKVENGLTKMHYQLRQNSFNLWKSLADRPDLLNLALFEGDERWRIDYILENFALYASVQELAQQEPHLRTCFTLLQGGLEEDDRKRLLTSCYEQLAGTVDFMKKRDGVVQKDVNLLVR